MKSAAAPIRIHERWVDDAACTVSKTDLRAPLWDDEIDGETDLQRKVRQEIAMHHCRTACPVSSACEAHAVRTRRKRLPAGVRGGRAFN